MTLITKTHKGKKFSKVSGYKINIQKSVIVVMCPYYAK